MNHLIPPFENVSEGIMASLASRPENWRLWSIEEFKLQTWEYLPASSRYNLVSSRFRGLLSLVLIGERRWRAKLYGLRGSPIFTTSELMRADGDVSFKRLWLKHLRTLRHDVSLSEAMDQLKSVSFHLWSPDSKVRLKSLSLRRKDSQGRFEESFSILRLEIWSSGQKVFSGSVEDFAMQLCK